MLSYHPSHFNYCLDEALSRMRQLITSGSTDYIAFACTGICVLFISLIYVWWLERSSGRLSCPGIPSQDEENGNLGEVTRPGGLHRFLEEHHGQLGAIFSFHWGKDLVVSLGSAGIFQDVSVLFQQSSEQYQLLKDLVDPRTLEFFSSPEGQKHYKVLERHTSPSAIQRFFPGFNSVAKQLVNKWSSATPGDHIPLTQHTLIIAMKSVIRTAFGDNHFQTNGEILQLQEACGVCWDVVDGRIHGGDVADSDTAAEFEEKLSWLRGKVREVITHRKNNKVGSAECLVDVLLEEEDFYSYVEDSMVDIIVVYVMGGFNTTAHLLSWIVYFLCTHSDVAEKVHEEIMHVVGSGDLTFDQCKKLNYLDRVINESIRCSNLVPVAVRSSTYDMMVGGHVIPKGTSFVQACGVVHSDPSIWHEPRKFNPDRFAAEEVKLRHPNGFQMIGFAGKRIVRYEVYAFVVNIVRGMKLQLVDQQQEIKYAHGLLTQISDDIWITAQSR